MKVVKKIWNATTTVLVLAVALLAVLLAGVRVFGLQVYTVLSGSMEPEYPVGSLIYVREAEDPTKIPGGTVITFMLSEDTIATHRVVAPVVDPEDPETVRYRTKGDANDTEDGKLVHYKNILGIPVFTIPWLGYLASFIQNPPGSYVTLCGGCILLVLVFVPDILFPDTGEEKKSRRGKYQRQ